MIRCGFGLHWIPMRPVHDAERVVNIDTVMRAAHLLCEKAGAKQGSVWVYELIFFPRRARW